MHVLGLQVSREASPSNSLFCCLSARPSTPLGLILETPMTTAPYGILSLSRSGENFVERMTTRALLRLHPSIELIVNEKQNQTLVSTPTPCMVYDRQLHSQIARVGCNEAHQAFHQRNRLRQISSLSSGSCVNSLHHSNVCRFGFEKWYHPEG